MMIETKLSSRIHDAQSVRYWLQDRGCDVIRASLLRRRAVIEVVCPPAELQERAYRIVETCVGGTRSVWTVFHDGCQIIWR